MASLVISLRTGTLKAPRIGCGLSRRSIGAMTLYTMFQDERLTGSFVVCCIERYRFHKHLSVSEAARLFDEHGVFAYIKNHSDALCTTGECYIVQDIESYIAATST